MAHLRLSEKEPIGTDSSATLVTREQVGILKISAKNKPKVYFSYFVTQ